MTLEDTRNAISSQESQDGPTLSDSQAGPMTEKSGPAPALANLLALRAVKEELPTSATCGPLFSGTSPSGDLQRCLESKLHRRVDGIGSALYVLTWKRWPMLSGPPICALRASGHRISDNGCGGWPTPTVSSGDQDTLNPTPGQTGGTTLGGAAKLAGWSTPTTRDHKSDRSQKTDAEIYGSKGKPLPRQALGSVSSTFHAEIGGKGQLNPGFARWLMGYPEEWASCVPTATPSSRK